MKKVSFFFLLLFVVFFAWTSSTYAFSCRTFNIIEPMYGFVFTKRQGYAFRWEAQPGAIKYLVEVANQDFGSTTSGFRKILQEEAVSNSFVMPINNRALFLKRNCL